MKIKSVMLMATAIVAGLTGCTKDEDSSKGSKEGLKASISITIPRITTYADDANAIADEVIFARADVFIYDGSTLETHETLDKDDFESIPGSDNAYQSVTKVETTTGPKEVYVGLNLPASIVNTIVNSGIKAGLATATQISVSDLVEDGSGTKGFAMFSVEGKTGTFVEDSDPDAETANKVSVAVERLVAKVTVQETTGLSKTVEGGTVSNLQFAMRNSNKYTYALQQKSGSVVIDPNWNSYVTSDATTDFESFTDYVAVNENGATLTALNNKYVPENTSEKHATEESTYASLRVAFSPSQFVGADGVAKSSTWATGNDFWTVTFSDGTLNYFDDEDEADDYILANPLKGGVKNEYASGYCYYTMFLDLNGGYNTIRNHYYKMTINSIKGLGNPNPEDGGNTSNPVPSSTNIDVDIDIVAWTLVTDGYDL